MKVYELREQDRKEWFLRLNREIAEHDRSSFLESAAQKGKLEGKIEGIYTVAQNMKKNGYSVSDISKNTGLSEEEINKL